MEQNHVGIFGGLDGGGGVPNSLFNQKCRDSISEISP